MKFTTRLKGFQDYVDLKATLTDKRGRKVIDTVTRQGDFNGRFTFRFNKSDLPGKRRQKKASLKLTIESLNNADETNLSKGGQDFTFDPIKQSSRFKLVKRKRNSSRTLIPDGVLINTDTTGPVFTSPNTVDPITEGNTSGKSIYRAVATDNNPPITYSLGGQDASSFTINANSGDVTFNDNADHSTKANYRFNVVATDSKGNPTTSSPLTLTIDKDLPPSFTSPKTITPVKEGSPKGTVIYTAAATDAGGQVTYSLTGKDATSFQIDPKSGIVTTQAGLNHDTQKSYAFNVIATESGFKKQQTSLPLTLSILKAGATLTKIRGKDILPPDTTNFSDTITAEVGTFLFGGTVQDPSTTDTDEISIKTNQFNKLESIFSGIGTKFINIEAFKILSTNDTSTLEIDLKDITNGKSFTFDSPSTFTATTKYKNWGTTGITDFNFSGIQSTFGIELTNAKSGFPLNKDSIKISGTPGPDKLEGLAGDTHLLGGLGIDNLKGSTAGQSTIAGGAGRDIIDFPTTGKQNTIDLTRQTTTTSRDTVTGYVGANAATKLAGSFDLIQINDGSFPNYTPGATVLQKTIAEAGASPSLQNTLIIDNEADIKRQVFPTGNQGLLAFAQDTNLLLFAPAGNFTANTQELLLLDSNIFSAPDQIKVIDA